MCQCNPYEGGCRHTQKGQIDKAAPVDAKVGWLTLSQRWSATLGRSANQGGVTFYDKSHDRYFALTAEEYHELLKRFTTEKVDIRVVLR